MADKDKASGMKSAYELALERLEKQGIERPREEGLASGVKEKVAELRRQAEAKLAELEILHKDRLRKGVDPVKRQEEEEEYVRERRRIEDDRDRKIERLRTAG
jgi:LPS O-antigen subunit length determinant protein (WzzB/FepE family)